MINNLKFHSLNRREVNKLEEMMNENDVTHPFRDDDSDEEIFDPGMFDDNSYGNIGTNNIPPNLI